MRQPILAIIFVSALAGHSASAADLGKPQVITQGDQDAALGDLSKAISTLSTIRSSATSPWLIALDVAVEIASKIYDRWNQNHSNEATNALIVELIALRTAIENERIAKQVDQREDHVLNELRSVIDDLLRTVRLLKQRSYRTCQRYHFRNSQGSCTDARTQ